MINQFRDIILKKRNSKMGKIPTAPQNPPSLMNNSTKGGIVNNNNKAKETTTDAESVKPEEEDPCVNKFKEILENVDKYSFISEFPHTIKLNKNAPQKFEKIKQIMELLNTISRDCT